MTELAPEKTFEMATEYVSKLVDNWHRQSLSTEPLENALIAAWLTIRLRDSTPEAVAELLQSLADAVYLEKLSSQV